MEGALRQSVVCVTILTLGCGAASTTGPATTPSTVGGHSSGDSSTVGPPAKVMVRPAVDTVLVGQTVQLADSATDSNGRVVKAVLTIWASRDTLVARVTQTGVLTARAAGVDTVMATVPPAVGLAVVVVRDTSHKPSTGTDTLTLFGFVKPDSGHCDPTTGCEFNNSVVIDVKDLFVWSGETRDQTEGFTVGVGSIDSVAWYQWAPGDVPPPTPGIRWAQQDCHTWTGTVLNCPASDSGTLGGYYVVYVEPAPVAGHVIGTINNNSFILTTFPVTTSGARVAGGAWRARSAGRVSSRMAVGRTR